MLNSFLKAERCANIRGNLKYVWINYRTSLQKVQAEQQISV